MTQLTAPRTGAVHRADTPDYLPAGPKLAAYIAGARAGTPIRRVPADVQDGAWQLVRETHELLGPSIEDDMIAWLGKLAPKVRGAPMTPGDVRAVYAGIWEDCRDLPHGVWCVETRRAWGRTPKGAFWPSAGELYQHLAAYAATIRDEARGCEKILAIANEAAPQEADPRKDPEQQEAVRSILAAWRAERTETQTQQAAEDRKHLAPRTNATLSDHSMLAHYERIASEGSPDMRAAAATRVEALRTKLGVSVEARA